MYVYINSSLQKFDNSIHRNLNPAFAIYISTHILLSNKKFYLYYPG